MIYFACIIIMSSCTLLGFMTASKYKDAEQFFYSLNTFCRQFTSNLSFQQHTVEQIIQKGSYCDNFLCYANHYLQINCQNRGAKDYAFLTITDKSYINDLFTIIGRTDKHSQLEQIQFFTQYSQQRLQECQTDNKNKGKMSQKLGIIAGILLCILIV